MWQVTLATTFWRVPFSDKAPGDEQRPLALIILNQPFSIQLLNKLWPRCRVRCCADGGANRLFDVLGASSQLRDEYRPDFVKGDLDSIRPEVREYFEQLSVPVIRDPDQYATDLMKCVHEIDAIESRLSQRFDVILLGGLSGRLDQTIHTLSYLHKLRKTRPRTFAVTDDNVGWVLDAGDHRILIDRDEVGTTCGLLPVGVQSTILSTRGLVWNLNGAESSFDGLVSTSNAVKDDEVCIKTSAPIWWCIELKT